MNRPREFWSEDDYQNVVFSLRSRFDMATITWLHETSPENKHNFLRANDIQPFSSMSLEEFTQIAAVCLQPIRSLDGPNPDDFVEERLRAAVDGVEMSHGLHGSASGVVELLPVAADTALVNGHDATWPHWRALRAATRPSSITIFAEGPPGMVAYLVVIVDAENPLDASHDFITPRMHIGENWRGRWVQTVRFTETTDGWRLEVVYAP